MPLESTTQFGASYKFGFQDSDAPTISGVTIRQAELRWEPEVNATATDGEGHIDSRVITKAENRQITGTFSGYIASSFDAADIAEFFSFIGRKFIVTNITDPRRKGEFNEVSIEAISNAKIT